VLLFASDIQHRVLRVQVERHVFVDRDTDDQIPSLSVSLDCGVGHIDERKATCADFAVRKDAVLED
jgi:hypothetical protein